MASKSSFSRNMFKFSVYKTAQHRIDESEVPDEDEEENNDRD